MTLSEAKKIKIGEKLLYINPTDVTDTLVFRVVKVVYDEYRSKGLTVMFVPGNIGRTIGKHYVCNGYFYTACQKYTKLAGVLYR